MQIGLFWTIVFPLYLCFFLVSSMQLHNSLNISETTLDFDLFSKPNLAGLVDYHFQGQPLLTEMQTLFVAPKSQNALNVCSARINKAEASLLIQFYRFVSDTEPSVTVSFGIDIHDPVELPNFTGSYNRNNVHVASKLQECETFEKITLARSNPQFLVLK